MKKIYIVIILLFIISVSIIIAAFKAAPKSSKTSSIPTPTAIKPNGTNVLPTNISITPTPQNIFQNKTIQKELDLLENRRPLTNVDATAKTLLINSIGNDGTTIYTSGEYSIIYIKSMDEFEVEIATTNIQKAKTDAVSWLLSKGMSHDGICKLPLIFYTNAGVYQSLKANNTKDVTPLADGC